MTPRGIWLAGVVLLSVVSTAAAQTSSDDPCVDPLYVSLKTKDLDSLTEREYQIFRQKDDACNRYRVLLANPIAGETPPPAPTPFPPQEVPSPSPSPSPLPAATPPFARPARTPLPAPPGFVLQGALTLQSSATDVDRRGFLLGAASAGVAILDNPERGRWSPYFGGGADVTWGGSREPGRYVWSAGPGTRIGMARFGGLARVPDATLSLRTTPFLAEMDGGTVGGVRLGGSLAAPGWLAWTVRDDDCALGLAPFALATSHLELGVETYGPRFSERVSLFYLRIGAGF
jgi:hypothetical protein